jgi:hypothetical protein
MCYIALKYSFHKEMYFCECSEHDMWKEMILASKQTCVSELCLPSI